MPPSSAPYRDELLAWYRHVQRDLPWRRNKDPYSVWVSEIMLQQTQVAAALPYFTRWMEKYPTVEALAMADEQEILGLWQGLGYYRRCRLLQQGAKVVAANGFPSNAEEWSAIPGVGRYTAGAIASIAQGQATPLVDGNVERVYARIKGRSTVGKEFKDGAWQWAQEVVDQESPGDWNQALMELGATVCKPVKPNCPACPVKGWCYAFQTAAQDRLPVKPPKLQTIPLHHACWVPYSQSCFGIVQIREGDWWQGMWQFPRVAYEPPNEPRVPVIFEKLWAQDLGRIRHQVTIHRVVLRVHLVTPKRQTVKLRWVTLDELQTLPMPAPQRRALQLACECLGLDPRGASAT